ncbi:hypothetical protein CDAR_516501 [Caerostris darwini]|uniref:Uncharacterized protein n=1 Tax=Caerostris darwini TaxID=1538125 RepID=A0AAV4WZH4_9ARAC|nr:hypothetical protein CDAR_516501 [Caerostris darwini]
MCPNNRGFLMIEVVKEGYPLGPIKRFKHVVYGILIIGGKMSWCPIILDPCSTGNRFRNVSQLESVESSLAGRCSNQSDNEILLIYNGIIIKVFFMCPNNRGITS